MAARYELHRTLGGQQFYWNLKAINGEIILTSETYVSHQGAHVGIVSCRVHSHNTANYVDKNNGNQCWFVLRAINGEIVGRSERYASNAGRDSGILSCKMNGPLAPIVDLT